MKRDFLIEISVNTKHKYEALNRIKKMLNENKVERISVKCLEKRRTSQQNKALHLYFTLLATSLNDAGADMRKTIRQDVDIQWTSYAIKEYLWKPIQKAMTGKTSTTRIKTGDIDKIFEILNKVIGERTGVYVPFPSFDNLILEEYN